AMAHFLRTEDITTTVETMREALQFPYLARRRDQAESTLAIALADSGCFDDARAAADAAAGDGGDATRVALTNWAVAEVAWLAGRPADAVAAAERVLDLRLMGF